MNIEKKLKGLEALEFKGEVEEGLVTVNIWLNDVKIVLEGLHCSEMEKLDGVVSLLRGHARQGNRTVYNYECDFNKLSRFSTELVLIEKDACDWFVEGLCPRLKELLIVLNLSSFQEVANCAKTLERAQNESERFNPLTNVISEMSAKKLLLQGCLTFIANMINTRVKEKGLEDIPTVQEFPYVFLFELPRLPPDRDIEFQIEVMPRTAPIAMSSYIMALKKLNELKIQLQKLLD
ncbi:uncharacterized protein LOC120122380 [Hibiscus syriacus]|uniref:uncharacterized protein LOC120122380 n=1 Tax=Hibiscus syriacus TaxID=106335 RepID=UPI001924803C|nr:uncharacterized protein LOC120122380 [Hibiscus syriacus]